jgi:PAS domain S-box-containing protein
MSDASGLATEDDGAARAARPPRARPTGLYGYASEIVRTLREPLLILDSDLRIQAASDAFYLTFKSAVATTIGRRIYELGSGQWDSPALRKLLEELLPSNGKVTDYTVEHDFEGIGQRTMLLNARQLHEEGSDTKLILVAIEDVTERRRAELEIARHRAWLATTLRSIGDALIATDVDARVIFMNPAAERLTGWAGSDANGRPLHEVFNIVNETTRKVVESPVSKALRSGSVVGLANHTLLIAKDGTERSIDDSAAPIRDKSSDPDAALFGVILVFHDITERRAAERKLQTSETRFRRLFEAAHDGVLILDVDTRRITDVNPFLMELLDYPREHFIGKELWEIGFFRDKASSQAAMHELHEKHSIRYENLPLEDRRGRRHPVDVVANLYLEDDASVIQCNIRDISARKIHEREREALLANEQAARLEGEAANRAKDIFLATLSHEVRTPLNAILGWATILRGKQCSDEEVREGMEVIERNCRAQTQLINDVLDISSIVSGKLRLELRPCDLAIPIEAAIETLRPAANARHVVIEADLHPSFSSIAIAAPPVFCDVDRMQQVMWNLLSNAVKFSAKGDTIRVALDRKGSQARIVVSDTGRGITPDFLPYVFDRFRQADGGTRRNYGGLGLGLSIVKHIVELHGGTVQAESDGEGRGSTFTVVLPIRAVTVADGVDGEHGVTDGSVDAALALIRIDGIRVLVVDDEADARRLIGKVLTDAGATVTVAGTVAEAMAALTRLHEQMGCAPDVLVSDLAMPDEDGFDLIRKVRAAGHGVQELPAVALTAFANKGYARSALLGGFQIHVSKPVDPQDLIAVVAALTGRAGPPPAKDPPSPGTKA